MNAVARLRAHRGPGLLSYGFRPFFLFGAIYAGLAILAWLPMFNGELALSTAFGPIDWHVHELLYGYLPAVVTASCSPRSQIGPGGCRCKACRCSRWWRYGWPAAWRSPFPPRSAGCRPQS